MLLTIKQIIDPKQMQIVRSSVEQATFVDGSMTAGQVAKTVKKNSEIAMDSQVGQQLATVVMGNLYTNQQFKDACLPLKVAQPIFARYEPGMAYGAHIDDPVMGDQTRLRCDIALTLFINNANEYEGGELTIETEFGPQSVKLNSGDVVIYPASSLHRVNEVTQGIRLVAVTWIQSMVADSGKRAILYELAQARNTLLFDQHNLDKATVAQVDHVYTNLVRRWSQV